MEHLKRKRVKLSEEDIKAFRSAAAQIWSNNYGEIELAFRKGHADKHPDRYSYSTILDIVVDQFYSGTNFAVDYGFMKETNGMSKEQHDRIKEYIMSVSGYPHRTIGKLLKGAI